MFRFIVGRGPVPRRARDYRMIARDRPSRYGMGKVVGDRIIARDRPSRYGVEDVSVYRRAGACPPPCCGLPNAREGQALALREGEGGWALGCSRGTGPRATG